MKPYSKDLRLKVLEALDRGMPRRDVAQIFGISLCRPSNAGSSGAEKQGRSRQDHRAPVLLPGRVQLLRKLYLPSLGQTPTSPSKSTNSSLRRATAFRSLRPASAELLSDSVCHSKKDALRFRARREEERGRWRERVRRIDPKRLVFVDECGTHTSMTRRYGRAPRGQRAYGSVPRNRGKNTTLLASLSLEGIGATMAVEGSTTQKVFEAYVEKVLAPTLRVH